MTNRTAELALKTLEVLDERDMVVYGFNDTFGEFAVRQLLADVAAQAQAAEAVA